MARNNDNPQLLDHIGWNLWHASTIWKKDFTKQMIDHGYIWFGEARGALIQHIGVAGIAQLELATRSGTTKQAVQQHLDDLALDGIVTRVVDPGDARKKLVKLTSNGYEALRLANMIKLQIEEKYIRIIGNSAMENLKLSLAKITEHSK